jgi:microcystin degradation protein MlrC
VKFAIAMLKHETNTFSPVPTPLESLGPDGPLVGDAAYNYFKGTGSPIGAFIDMAEAMGADVHIPAAARTMPSGPVHQAAFDHVADLICDSLKEGYDALFLDLHGAMVAEDFEDGEGELLARIRAVAPDLPIAVGLDFHANMSEEMIRNCDVLVGYKTYPHMDMYEAGQRAGELLLEFMAGKIAPRMVVESCPILPNIVRMATDEAPMREIMTLAGELETGDVLSVSVFPGFPLADTSKTRLSVVAVENGNSGAAEDACRRILELAWRGRDDFSYESEPLEDSVRRAKKLTDGPVLLIDLADNCNSGGTLDTMTVIAEALKQGLDNVVAGPICDPQAVQQLIEAGVGAHITLPLGGKMDMPSIDQRGQPLVLSGTVKTISDGRFIVRGPVFTGMQVELGRTVVFDTGAMEILLSEDRIEPLDLAMFRFVGIEPLAKSYIILKSKIQYRPTFGAMAKHIIECDSDGVAGLNFERLPFKNLARPIYPLDQDASFKWTNR